MLVQLQPVQDSLIDRAVLEKLRRLMEPESFRAVLDSFLDRSRVHIGNAERCLAEGDLEKLKYTVHTIKGSSANLGLTGLSQLCADMEKQIKQGETVENLRQHFVQVLATFEDSRDYITDLTESLLKTG